jgi:uncharacterized protein YodC (DUF2158 family)
MSGIPMKPGDTVRLRSGGPAMTVIKKFPACWECVWFAGDERRTARFVEPDLVADPPARNDDESLIALGSAHEDRWVRSSNTLRTYEDFDDLTRACL